MVIFSDADVNKALVTSMKKYYIRFRVELWQGGGIPQETQLRGLLLHGG